MKKKTTSGNQTDDKDVYVLHILLDSVNDLFMRLAYIPPAMSPSRPSRNENGMWSQVSMTGTYDLCIDRGRKRYYASDTPVVSDEDSQQ
jgi:hypothetical protein